MFLCIETLNKSGRLILFFAWGKSMIKETNFQHLTKLYQSYISEISWNQEPTSLYEPFDYIMQQQGKIRPLSLLLSYGLFSDTLTAALPAAYGLELFHNFTLIHDDIMDQAALRRGKPTVHQKYGESSAILSGDAMLLESLQMILKAAGPRNAITRLFINSGIEVCQGQAMDMDFENSQSVRLQEYLEMIEKRLRCFWDVVFRLEPCWPTGKTCNTLYQIGLNLGKCIPDSGWYFGSVMATPIPLEKRVAVIWFKEKNNTYTNTSLKILTKRANKKFWRIIKSREPRRSSWHFAWRYSDRHDIKTEPDIPLKITATDAILKLKILILTNMECNNN